MAVRGRRLRTDWEVMGVEAAVHRQFAGTRSEKVVQMHLSMIPTGLKYFRNTFGMS